MGGDKEEGMEVIGQQSRETLNLFFPTDQQLFTQHHKDITFRCKQTNKQTNKQISINKNHWSFDYDKLL